MRKGALLVGRRADSFATDLARMPMLIGRFVLSPVLILWRGVKSDLESRPSEDASIARRKDNDFKPQPGLIDEG
jgi:hypothetical protein